MATSDKSTNIVFYPENRHTITIGWKDYIYPKDLYTV